MIEKPLLAATLDDIETLKYPVLASPKLDGIRAITKGGQLLSRKFKPIPNQKIQQLFKDLPDGLDGELYMPNTNFHTIQSKVMTINNEDLDGLSFFIFDYVKDDPKKPYIDRIKDLDNLLAPPTIFNGPIVQLTSQFIVNKDQLLKFEAECLEAGYEGIMVRSLEGKYKFGRSTLKEGILSKLKQFVDTEATIIGFVERLKNTNEATIDELGYTKRSHAKDGMVPADTLGAIRVQYGELQFEIGSGFNDELRKEIWTNQDRYLNQTITFKYQPAGVHPETGCPRFPVFLGVRLD